MASIGEDTLTRVSTTAADEFTEAYYNALHGARATLASFYVPKTVLPTGRLLPNISYNGQQINDPDELQKIYQTEMPFAYFEIQSLNAHVINPALAPLDQDKAKQKDIDNNMSVLVQVSGYVRLIERKEGPMRAFTDSLIIVPNKETVGAKGKDKTGEGRTWVIQTQNFRYVV